MNERDVITQWRQLFHGREVTKELLAQAQLLLSRLGGESPLRLRLTEELDEIRKLSQRR